VTFYSISNEESGGNSGKFGKPSRKTRSASTPSDRLPAPSFSTFLMLPRLRAGRPDRRVLGLPGESRLHVVIIGVRSIALEVRSRAADTSDDEVVVVVSVANGAHGHRLDPGIPDGAMAGLRGCRGSVRAWSLGRRTSHRIGLSRRPRYVGCLDPNRSGSAGPVSTPAPHHPLASFLRMSLRDGTDIQDASESRDATFAELLIDCEEDKAALGGRVRPARR
jgi:hypothetical protein